jgi:hypothetical protein
MPSSSGCDGDKDWECWYESWQNWGEQWCVDHYNYCPSWDDGGALIKSEPASGGGGGWP